MSEFDPAAAVSNRDVAQAVEKYKLPPAIVKKEHIWSCEVNMVDDTVGELTLSIENAMLRANPSLFLAVVDHSGSMSGNPWNQVKSALLHIEGLSRTNKMVTTTIIGYSDVADIIATTPEAINANRSATLRFFCSAN